MGNKRKFRKRRFGIPGGMHSYKYKLNKKRGVIKSETKSRPQQKKNGNDTVNEQTHSASNNPDSSTSQAHFIETAALNIKQEKGVTFLGCTILHKWIVDDTTGDTKWYTGKVTNLLEGQDGDINAVYEVQYEGEDTPCEVDDLLIDYQKGSAVLLKCEDVLRCKCAFYNMDVDSAEFACQVLENEGIRYILLYAEYTEDFRKALATKHELTEMPQCCLDSYRMYRIDTIPYKPHKLDMAYFITTSGTTGSPKVVQVPHSCIVPNITHLRQIFNISTSDIVLMASPLTFDPSLVEVFMTLTSGACLLVLPRTTFMNPDLLLHTVYNRNKVTIMQITPTLLTRFDADKLSHTLLGDQSPLRVLALGGEQFPSMDYIRKIKSSMNTTSLYNLYGTTEVSCWATCCYVQIKNYRTDDRVPIGRCLQDTYVEVRDGTGHVLSEGTGELFIGGYHRQCMLSSDGAELFDTNVKRMRSTGDMVEILSDGQIHYLHRTDRQVKRNGKRINLVEIKEATCLLNGIHQCEVLLFSNKIVVFIVSDKTDKIMPASLSTVATETSTKVVSTSRNIETLNYVANDEDHDSPGEVGEIIRKQLTNKLPHHSLPDVVIQVDNLPMTEHGKVDMKKLEEVYNTEIEQKLSEDPLHCLQQSWKNLLGSKADFEDQSNFISAGGNSLKALQLMNELEKSLSKPLPDLLDIILQKTYRDIKQFIIKEHNLIITNVDKQGEGESLMKSDTIGNNISNTNLDSSEKHSIDILTCAHEKRNIAEEFKSKRKLSEDFKLNKAMKYDCDFYTTISRGSKFTYLNCFTKREDIDCHSSNTAIVKCTSVPNVRFRLCEKWKYDTRKCVDASPLLAISRSQNDSVVYIGSHSHAICAVKLETGDQLWETTLPDRIESSACLTLCGQYAVVGCYNNRVYCLHSNNGDIWWSFDTGGQVKSSPSVDAQTGYIYIGSHSQYVYCLSVKEKAVVWKAWLQAGSIFSSPCVWYNPHSVYVGSLGGKIFSISAASGDIVWQVSLGKPVFSSLAACGSGVVVGCTDNMLYYYSHQGQKIWSFQTNGPIFSSPVIYNHNSHHKPDITSPSSSRNSTHVEDPKQICDDTSSSSNIPMHTGQKQLNTNSTDNVECNELICVGCHDSYVYCLNLKGEIVWKVKANSMVYSTPFMSVLNLPKYEDKSYSELLGHCKEVVSACRHLQPHCIEPTKCDINMKGIPQIEGNPACDRKMLNEFPESLEKIAVDRIRQSNMGCSDNRNMHLSSLNTNPVIKEEFKTMCTYTDIEKTDPKACISETKGEEVENNDTKCLEPSSSVSNLTRPQTISGNCFAAFTRTQACTGSSGSVSITTGFEICPGYSRSVSNTTQTQLCTGRFNLDSNKTETQCFRTHSNHKCNSSALAGFTKGRSEPDIEGTLPVVVFCSSKGAVYMAHALTGEILCERDLPYEIFSSPVVHNDTIIIGCRDNYVYSLRLERVT